MKKISVLGSTGSIGTQTLEVVDASDNLSVSAVSTNTNIDLLEKQIKKYKPAIAAVYNEDKAGELKKRKLPCLGKFPWARQLLYLRGLLFF